MSEDQIFLSCILEYITNVEDLTRKDREAFEAAKHDRAAALYYLQTMAETTQRLSEAIKATQPEIDWIAISGFRNRLGHGYLKINMDVVWSVVQNYLPDLKRADPAMLASLEGSS